MVYRASCLNFSPHSGFFSLANNKGHAPLFRWDRTSAPVNQNYLKYLVLQMSFCRRPRRRHPAGRLCVCRFRVLMLFVLVCLCLRLPTQQNVQNNVWTTNIPAHTDDRDVMCDVCFLRLVSSEPTENIFCLCVCSGCCITKTSEDLNSGGSGPTRLKDQSAALPCCDCSMSAADL